MNARVFIYLIPYLISLAITTGLGAYAWRRKDVTGARTYAWVMVGQSLWILGYIIELLTPTLDGKIFWDDAQFFGGVIWALAFLAFTFQYAGVRLRHPILVWSLLCFLPVLFCVLLLSNPLHGWVRSSSWLVPGDPFDELVYDFTPAVLAWTAYGLGSIFAGLAVLARRYLRPGGAYRAQAVTIIMGTMVPLVGTVLTALGLTVTFHRDTTPFTFAVGSSIVMWGLFRYRLFDVVPAARNYVVESISDAVVILDARNRVVDLNQAAASILDQPREQAIGQSAEIVFTKWMDLLQALRTQEQVEIEITLDVHGQLRYLDVRISPVQTPRGRHVGRLIVIRDISARKRAEAQRDESLEALTQERDLIAAILDTAGALVLVLDPSGEIIRLNQACERMTGYTQDEVRGERVWSLFVPEHEVALFRAALKRVRPGAEPVLHENQWIARDGTLRRIAWSNTALLDEEGQVRYIVSVGIDVEEERRRQHEANVLADTARLVSSSLDLKEVLDHTAEQTMDILQADRCLIGLYDSDQTLRCAADRGFPPALSLSLRKQELVFTDRTRQTVLEALEPLTIPDIEADPRVDPNVASVLGIQSALLVPIEVSGQGLGLILLGTQPGHKRAFAKAEEKLARAMASQAAMAISNARWYASLQDELAARIQAERALLEAQQDLERRVQERTADLAAANENLRAEMQERERAEEQRDSSLEALHDSEDRFRSLVQQLSDIVVVIDPNTRIQYATPSCQEILGYSPEDMMGNFGLEYVHPEDVAYLTAEMDNLSDRESEILAPVEFRVRHKNGHWVHFEAKATNLLHTPSVGGIVITARDITERRRLEAQFFQAQKMEAVGRLAGGVAHDFNNLLTAIQGYTLFLLNDLQVDDPASWPSGADLRADLSEIAKASERASALTKQLLAFSRKQVMETRILDLNDVVTGIEPMLRRLIGEDIDLDTRLAPLLGRVKADPGQIEQVIVNLVVNARDAMPEGGRLTIETESVFLDQIFVREHPGANTGPHVKLAVRDTGTGMDEQVLERLFEPFFTTKPAGQGTGLGLATVYGIVKQSDGYICPSSELGQGSIFEVYLPRIDQDVMAEAPEQKGIAPENRSGTETILIVEDEPMVRELSGRVLEDLGYVVVLACHPREGLVYVEQHMDQIDLLITDVIMPGMSGKDLADQILERCPGLRVLYISGYTDDAIADHGVLSPDLDFLPKPFTPDKLAQKVREVLDQPH